MKIKSEIKLPMNARLSDHEIYVLDMSRDKLSNKTAQYAQALCEAEKELRSIKELLIAYCPNEIGQDLSVSENVATILINKITGCKIDDRKKEESTQQG